MAREPGDGFEIGLEHDDTLLARGFDDQCVQRPLGRREPAARLPVAVVHDDKGHPVARQIRANSGMFGLPPHSMTEIASRSTSRPSAENTNGSTSFSVKPSTSTTARARKSSLRAASNSVTTRKSSSADTGSG